MQEYPLVSIVTPSYNMAGFLEETIQSVLSQDYANIEYIVMDGGSTDGTRDILERYRDRLRYVSAPDRGAADAINRGFESCRGSIFGWLNADDTYLPGAISAAVRYLSAHDGVMAAYGEAYWVDTAGKILARYPTLPYTSAALALGCFICQPACLIRSAAFRSVGMLDENLQSAFDYDLWVRLAKQYPFGNIPEYLATSRMHASNKTLGLRKQVYRETFDILKRHYSYVPLNWIGSYCAYIVDGRDQFYQSFQPSIWKYALSLPVGLWHNWRHPWRYCRDWVSIMSIGAAVRWWNRSALARVLQRRSRH